MSFFPLFFSSFNVPQGKQGRRLFIMEEISRLRVETKLGRRRIENLPKDTRWLFSCIHSSAFIFFGIQTFCHNFYHGFKSGELSGSSGFDWSSESKSEPSRNTSSTLQCTVRPSSPAACQSNNYNGHKISYLQSPEDILY